MTCEKDNSELRFSIVIPTKNRDHTIMRALRSLQQQTIVGWEAIVVDDHSSSRDRTKQLIADAEDSRISYFQQTTQQGAAAARNYGVRQSRGAYIAFLDSDDYFLPDKLDAMRTAIENHPVAEKCVFYSQYRAERSNDSVTRPTRAIREDESVGDYLFVNDGLLQTSGLILSRKLALDVPFDETLPKHQDYDLVLRLQRCGATFHFLPKVLTVWSLETAGPSLGSSGDEAYSVQWVNRNRNNLSATARKAFLVKHILKNFEPWQGRAQYLRRLRQSNCWTSLTFPQKLIALSLLLPVKLRGSASWDS